MKLYSWLITIVISVFIIAEIILIWHESFTFSHSHILLMLFIVALVNIKSKISWWLMLAVCVYGLFDLFYFGSKASDATLMDFAGKVNIYLSNFKTAYFIRWGLSILPVVFYAFTIVVYLLNYKKLIVDKASGSRIEVS